MFVKFIKSWGKNYGRRLGVIGSEVQPRIARHTRVEEVLKHQEAVAGVSKATLWPRCRKAMWRDAVLPLLAPALWAASFLRPTIKR